MEEAHVVGDFAQLWNQIGNHLARFAARLELPRAFREHSLLALKRHQVFRARHRLTMLLDQFRLVIECVNLATGAGAENHQHILCRRFVMRIACGKRAAWDNLRTNWACFVRQKALVLQQTRECDTAQSRGRL